MAFTSASFALFCIVGLIFYYIAPKKARWFVLLVLSYVFYLSGSVGSGAYILFTTVTTYTAGRIIGNFQKGETKEEKQQAKSARKIIAGICLFLNFGLLYFVKYWNFTFITTVKQKILRIVRICPAQSKKIFRLRIKRHFLILIIKFLCR